MCKTACTCVHTHTQNDVSQGSSEQCQGQEPLTLHRGNGYRAKERKEEEWHARPREWQAQRLGGENNLQNVGQEDGAVGPAKVGSYLKSWKLVAHCSWGDSNKERGQGAYN